MDTEASLKRGFTLAEILITIGILGIVSAIILPSLIVNIQARVKAKRIENITQKFSKATDKMLAMSGMSGYGSTENFVNELSKHLKLAKICDNDNLDQCWPYATVYLTKDKKTKVNISDIKTGGKLMMKNNDTHEWDNTVGIVTADGTSMILSYNKRCSLSENINPTWDSAKSSSTECVSGVFDWNGAKGPNLYSNIANGDKADVISFNSKGLGSVCGLITGNGRCLNMPFKQTKYLTQTQCESQRLALGIGACGMSNDYWAAGVKACGHKNKMATREDLSKVASFLYKGGVAIRGNGNDPNLTPILENFSLIGLPNPNSPFCIYANYESGGAYASQRCFYSDHSYAHGWSISKGVSNYIMCADE